mgnify:FL=1
MLLSKLELYKVLDKMDVIHLDLLQELNFSNKKLI